MKVKPLENAKNQIGFCGIWCGSCVVGNGVLTELTKRYEKVIRDYDVEDWGPEDFSFQEFLKGLASIQAMPLCQGCLKGGGRQNCEIRACASNKRIAGCSLCNQTATCENKEILQKMRSGARRAGLLVKTTNVDREELTQKWTAEMKKRWPTCILFLPSR